MPTIPISMTRHLFIRILCYVVSAAALLTAAGYLARGDDKGLGVFLVLLAAVISRVLVLNVAIPMEHTPTSRDEPDSGEPAEQSAR